MGARDGALVTIGDRKFTVDTENISWGTVQPTRQGVDQGAGAGEASLSNEVVWRRVRDNWVGGAGQEVADLIEDEDESSPIRYASSDGVIPWERGKLTAGYKTSRLGYVNARGLLCKFGNFAIDSSTEVDEWGDDGSSITVRGYFHGEFRTGSLDEPFLTGPSGFQLGLAPYAPAPDYEVVNVDVRIEIGGAELTGDVNLSKDTLAQALEIHIDLSQNGGNVEADFYVYALDSFGDRGDLIISDLGVSDTGTLASLNGALESEGASDQLEILYYMALSSGAGNLDVEIDFTQVEQQLEGGDQPAVTGTGSDGVNFSYTTNATFTGYVGSFPVPPTTGTPANGYVNLGFNDQLIGVFPRRTFAGRNLLGFWLVTKLGIEGWTLDPDDLTTYTRDFVFRPGGECSYIFGQVEDDDITTTGPITGAAIGGDGRLYFSIPGYPYKVNDKAIYRIVVTDDGVYSPALGLNIGDSAYLSVERFLDGGELGDSTLVPTVLGAADSRLLGRSGSSLYEIGSSEATLIYSHFDAGFRWLGAQAAPNAIYVYGSTGTGGQIYQLPISDADGAVDPPIPAGNLPVGENLLCFEVYLGVALIGTSRGFRLGTITGDGSVQIGPVLEDFGGVTAIATIGTYAYLCTTGRRTLVRLNLARFTEPLVPAFALESTEFTDDEYTYDSDVEVIPQSICLVGANEDDVDNMVPVFASEHLIYTLAPDSDNATVYCEDATIDLGWFTYGIGEELSFDSLSVEGEAHDGSSTWTADVYLDTPDTQAVVSGTLTWAADTRKLTLYADDDIRATRFRVRIVIHADTTAGTTPTINRVVLRSTPVPFMSDVMILPLILTDRVQDESGQDYDLDVLGEFTYLLGLRDTRERVAVTIGDHSVTARVEDVTVQSGGLGGGNGLDGFTRDESFVAGTWNVRLVTVEPAP